MRTILVKERMTLDGIFDAENMDQWWFPFDRAERRSWTLLSKPC